MSRIEVHPPSLADTAATLDRLAGGVAAIIPELAAGVAGSGLVELAGFGLLGGVPVAADLAAMCLPGTVSSLPDAVVALTGMAAAVRAAETAYVAVDELCWARSELPTAEALLMLAAWNRLHLAVNLTSLATGAKYGPVGPAQVLDWGGETVLGRADHWIEGAAHVREVDPSTMPALTAQPAHDLASLLGVVDTISEVDHPSTAALLHVGPNRWVVCLPGLQNGVGADGGAADLPGALATLTGHSAYIDGMRHVLASLPPGAHVLLVGHSQGGMVAEALSATPRIGDTTIDGLLTAGAPLLAASTAVPYLALQNRQDPVPALGRLAGSGTGDQAGRRTLLEFSTKGRWMSGAKHRLGSGGYLAIAGSDDPRVTAFASRFGDFLTDGPVDVRYLQVTDTDGPLPP